MGHEKVLPGSFNTLSFLSPVGKLVIADSNRPILLRTKHILIGNKGELHIGSPDCPYKGNLTISLFGRYSCKHRDTVFFNLVLCFQSDTNLHFNIKNKQIAASIQFNNLYRARTQDRSSGVTL